MFQVEVAFNKGERLDADKPAMSRSPTMDGADGREQQLEFEQQQHQQLQLELVQPEGPGLEVASGNVSGGVSNSVPVAPVEVALGYLNLGGGGFGSYGMAAVSRLALNGLDVMALTETHLHFGTECDTGTPDCTCLTYKRKSKLNTVTHSAHGGVALLVNTTATSNITEARVMQQECSRRADVLWCELKVAGAASVLYVGVFYAPPDSCVSNCKRDRQGHDGVRCLDAACPLSHPKEAMVDMGETAQRLGRHGRVFIIGDFNASPRLQYSLGNQRTAASTRWVNVVKPWTARLGLVVGNLRGADGEVAYTRRGTNHGERESVLDLCFYWPESGVTVGRQRICSDSAVSDHYFMSFIISMPSVVQLLAPLAPAAALGVQAVGRAHDIISTSSLPVGQSRLYLRRWHSVQLDSSGAMQDGSVALPDPRYARFQDCMERYAEQQGALDRANVRPAEQLQQLERVAVEFLQQCGIVYPIGTRQQRRDKLDAGHLQEDMALHLTRMRGIELAKRALRKAGLAVAARSRECAARGNDVWSRHLLEAAELKRCDAYEQLNCLWRQNTVFTRQRRAAGRWAEQQRFDFILNHGTQQDIAAMDSQLLRNGSRNESCRRAKSRQMRQIEAVQRAAVQRVELRRQEHVIVGTYTDPHLGVPAAQLELTPNGRAFLACKQELEVNWGAYMQRCVPTLDAPFTHEEVTSAVGALKMSAAGLGLPLAAVKHVLMTEENLQLVADAFNDIYSTGDIPDDFTAVLLVLLPKPNDRGYRSIGVSNVLSRVIQYMVNRRLMRYLVDHQCLEECHCAFLQGHSVEGAALLSHMIESQSAVPLDSKHPLYTVYLDIKSAFASCPHHFILKALADLGIQGVMLRFIRSWLEKSSYNTANGDMVLIGIAVTLGLIEGNCFSPLLWACFINPLAKALVQDCAAPRANVGPAVQPRDNSEVTVGGVPFPLIVFADDIKLSTRAPDTLQRKLDIITESLGDWNLRCSYDVGKSEGTVSTTYERNGIRKRKLTAEEASHQFVLGGVQLRRVQTYKHLGIQVHCNGGSAGAKLRDAYVSGKQGRTIDMLANSGIRSVAPMRGRHLIISRLRPVTGFGAGIHSGASTAPVSDALCKADESVQRALLRAPGVPVEVVRSVLAIVSLDAEARMSRLRICAQMLSRLPTSAYRRGLKDDVRLWDRLSAIVDVGAAASKHSMGAQAAGVHRQRLWWHHTNSLLSELEEMEGNMHGGNAQDIPPPPFRMAAAPRKYLQLVREFILGDVDSSLGTDMGGNGVREQLEDCLVSGCLLVRFQDRNADRVQVAKKLSLSDTAVLITGRATDSRHAMRFLAQPRTTANTLRVHLRAGSRYMFTHMHFRKPCPWCAAGESDDAVRRVAADGDDQDGAVDVTTNDDPALEAYLASAAARLSIVSLAQPSMRHLLVECTAWAQRRTSMKESVQLILGDDSMRKSVTTVASSLDSATSTQWFLLMAGAPVEAWFLNTTVFQKPPRLSNSVAANTAQRQRDADAYDRVLHVTGEFLVEVITATQRHFGVKRYYLPV